MANHLHQLLDNWFEHKDQLQWVLATIIGTEGSSYRKTGAMMMINSLGKYHGLLSGGCLESDIMRQSRRCWEDGRNRIIQYDMREEEDLAWQLGIGCGGLVRILLQPVDTDNQYLRLDQLRGLLQQNKYCCYRQNIDEDFPNNDLMELENEPTEKFQMGEQSGQQILSHFLKPAPHLAVFGGGVDAIPLVSMAGDLGWQVTLVDPRPSYARASHFGAAKQIVRSEIHQLQNAAWLNQLDVAILMNHNVELDAQSLALLKDSSAKYLGILGPTHRTDRVFDAAGLNLEMFTMPISNPVGLRLGGELPESIALSILSEVHAFLEQADGRSISGLIP